jgi:3'-phosphoadenosine 5'-phosphosulfate sulfotransferase (PAPS reductase)/FAD synthetase
MTIIVPISGGKDSQACLKLAICEAGLSNVRALHCATHWEHPLTDDHIKKLTTLYGAVDIDIIDAGTVMQLSLRYRRFPGGGANHCTTDLKIRPTRRYLLERAQAGEQLEVWWGMRTGESAARSKRYANVAAPDLYQPHEIMPSQYSKTLGKLGVRFRLPIIDWTEAEVLNYIAPHANPLYAAGFPHVGCFPCMAGGDRWKALAFGFDETGRDHEQQARYVAKLIGRSIWESKAARASDIGPPPCGICQS